MQAKLTSGIPGSDPPAVQDYRRQMRGEIMDARTTLILELAAAPQSIRSHSRVVDVARALDQLEGGLATIERQLLRTSRTIEHSSVVAR